MELKPDVYSQLCRHAASAAVAFVFTHHVETKPSVKHVFLDQMLNTLFPASFYRTEFKQKSKKPFSSFTAQVYHPKMTYLYFWNSLQNQ